MHRFLSLTKRVLALYHVSAADMALARAQYGAFSRQIPLLYFILVTNSLAGAWTFSKFAPAWLAVYVPLGLSCVCVMRALWFWRTRHKMFSDAQVLAHMRLTARMAGIITLGFTAWGLMLFPYGDPYAKGQMIFGMALNVIGCAFCMMHLRPAALSIVSFANIPFVLFFFTEGHPAYRAVAINLALVSVTLVAVLQGYNRDFARMVASEGETRRLSDENFRIANLDTLTQLPNRRWFFTTLEKHFEAVARTGEPFAVGMIDLDGFKPVNDTYGHATGDRLLAEVGRRLREVCGGTLALARLGGDEFAILVGGDVSAEALKALGGRIGERLRLPYAIGTAQAQINSSIGFAIYPHSADTPDTLFERADYALYHAKRHRRGGTVLFSAEHEAQIRSDSVIEQALQAADLGAEMSLLFQPIVDANSGRILAMEALARWRSPLLGAVGPADFIPAAERIGLIRTVTRVLLTKALAQAAAWPEDVRLSFNLSAHDIASPDCILAIIAAVSSSGVSPKRIDFEITETAVTQDFEAARAGIDALRVMGAGISLDDFGTGYSSLSHVHRLPLTKLKIDRSFVTDICDNPTSVKIVKSLLTLCADMGLDCVLEGVETADQAQVLRSLSGAMMQGYYFARPMPAAAVSGYLAAGAAQSMTRAG